MISNSRRYHRKELNGTFERNRHKCWHKRHYLQCLETLELFVYVFSRSYCSIMLLVFCLEHWDLNAIQATFTRSWKFSIIVLPDFGSTVMFLHCILYRIDIVIACFVFFSLKQNPVTVVTYHICISLSRLEHLHRLTASFGCGHVAAAARGVLAATAMTAMIHSSASRPSVDRIASSWPQPVTVVSWNARFYFLFLKNQFVFKKVTAKIIKIYIDVMIKWTCKYSCNIFVAAQLVWFFFPIQKSHGYKTLADSSKFSENTNRNRE